MSGLSAKGTRVLLAGCGSYQEGSGLPRVGVAAASVHDLGQALVERCGLDRDNLRIMLDPATPTELGAAVAEETERAEGGVLWFHYVGHGLVSADGQLYLATASTDVRQLWIPHTALAYAAVRGSLLESRASALVVTLDCCFSGRAVGTLGTGPEGVEAELARIDGGFVLAAAARDELALAPEGAAHTAFTGEFIRLLRQGDDEASMELTLLGASRCLQRSLRRQGLPVPRQRASERAGELVLCSNPAYRPPVLSAPAGGPLGTDGDEAAQVCPYPGLASFGPDQAQWFFGRNELLEQLESRLAERMDIPDPLMVVGPSGSGKSSLLGAGLLPALGRGGLGLPGSESWPYTRFTPTGRPLSALAVALADLGGQPVEEVAAELAAQPERVCGLIRGLLQDRADGESVDQARLVLVVDQFEEVFALCADAGERKAFIRALSTAASGDSGAPCTLVVIGVRADFYADCLAYPSLQRALEHAPVVVGPLTTAGLAAAITEPARLCRLVLQPGLAELMLRDLGVGGGEGSEGEAADAGALPLLAHALRAVWERRAGRTLTLEGYRDAGGIHGAVAATAEACYDSLGRPALQTLARTLFVRLIQVGDKTPETRRRVRPDELVKDLPSPDAESVLEALTGARLVTVDTDAVEIAHEALIRAWPRLKAWVETDRAGLLVHQRLSAAATQWESGGRQESDLRQQTGLLSEEVAWAATAPVYLRPTSVERDFLEASVALRRLRARTRRAVRAVVGVLLVMALVGGLLAWQRSRALAHDHLQSAARNIAARAETLRGFDPQVAMLLNVAAWKTAPVVEARSGLLTAAVQQNQDIFSLPDLPDAELHLSDDGRVVVSADSHGAGAMRVWNALSKELTRQFEVPVPRDEDAVRGSTLSPDGRKIAVQSGAGVRLWDTSTGKPVSAPVGGSAGRPLALSASGDTLVLAVTDHVEVWNTHTLHEVTRIPRMASVAELGGRDRVALCDWLPEESNRGAQLTLWSLRSGHMIGKELTPKPGTAVCDEGSLRFSPDGALLAAPLLTTQDTGDIRLWNARSAQLLHSPEASFTVLGPGFPFAISVAFSPDGKNLAVADDREIVLSRVAPDGLWSEISYPLQSEGADYLVFSPDGRTLRFLRGSEAGTAVRSVRPYAGMPRTSAGPAAVSTISADGTVVAVQRPGEGRNEIRIVDGASGKAVADFVIETMRWPGSRNTSANISSMALSKDGRILVVSDPQARTATVWDTRSHQEKGQLTFSAQINQLSFQQGGGLLLSAGGKVVAAAVGDGKTIEALDVGTGAMVGVTRGVKGQPLAIGADGRLMVTDAGQVINLSTGQRRHVVLAHYAAATQAAFSPDGKFLAATDYAGGLALWNADATKRLTYLDGGSAYAYGHGTRPRGGILSFSMDGRSLAVQHPLAPKVQLWDTHSLRHIGDPLPVPEDLPLTSGIAFGPQNKDLRIVGQDGNIIWEQPSTSRHAVFFAQSTLDPSTLVHELCARVGRDLTRAEWALYIPEVPYQHVCA
ncbi:caspase family protein [Streptomyces sp. NBC_01715]|uniref:caspase, EACC1-associated type n=1 Tax=Streptomyces sp. NBC_01715 TaxID=2975916 RepID=UPI003FCE63F2